MNTDFATAEKVSDKVFDSQIEAISNSPIMSGLLDSISGLLAILNEHRQIVAFNDSFARKLGIDNYSIVLGLRPGEAFSCVHAHKKPAGCGTTTICSTCGAAIAIVTSLEQDKPAERICALTMESNGRFVDLALIVKSHPIEIGNKRFLLLFLQDITHQQKRASLERTFFHDINNMLGGLVGASELLYEENEPSKLVQIIYHSALRLKKEVDIQRYLLQSDDAGDIYKPIMRDVEIFQITNELKQFFANHPIAKKKSLETKTPSTTQSIKTDLSLLLRVLCNMISNAFEATDINGIVKLWIENNDNTLSFCIWNNKQIPDDISLRIFQRNFSTKPGEGRGIGTYSMKLFGEQILGGKVNFTTSSQNGTIFRYSQLNMI